MGALSILLSVLVSTSAMASSTILQVTGYDFDRQRAQIALSQDAIVPVGTRLRINALNGESCIIEVMERVNNTLIAKTPDCNGNIVRSGLKLAYSDGRSPDYVSPAPQEAPLSYDTPMTETASTNADPTFDNPVEEIAPSHPLMTDDSLMADENDWPSEGQFNSPSTYSSGVTTASSESLIPSEYAALRDRISVYIGHNFSSNLEGKVYADGTYKDLDGNTAFSLGLQGQVYDITPKIGVIVGMGYEFARSFDEATLTDANNVQYKGAPLTGNPRLSLWSLYTQVEGQLLDKLNAFGGVNFSIPFLSRVTWEAKTDIGFQAGANYLVYDRVRVEGLIKISNLNLTNELGETTDVSLAGVEIRGRYTF